MRARMACRAIIQVWPVPWETASLWTPYGPSPAIMDHVRPINKYDEHSKSAGAVTAAYGQFAYGCSQIRPNRWWYVYSPFRLNC